MTSLELAQSVCKSVAEKKGDNIIMIRVEEKTVLCDYFVIASGHSTTQVRAIAENVDERMKKWNGLDPLRKEGLAEGRWAVLDYGGVIVHVFNDESRDFYNLERLWENGNNVIKYEE